MKPYAPNRKILFLDDEANLLKSLARLATRLGFEPTVFSNAQDALSAIEKECFGVIISDYRMPEMVGTEFLSLAKKKSPNTLRILLTGYADISAAIQAVNESCVYRYLTKPWEEAQIRSTLEEAFRQFNLTEENLLLQEQVKQAALQLREINRNLEETVERRTTEIKELNWKLESGFLGSIKLMGTVAHRGDLKSSEHARRVALLCVEVGKAAGWTGRDLLELQIAGYLHDLTETADKRNPNHAQEAYELMTKIPNLGQAYDYVRHHHERLNGSGPAKLSGDQISLGARILGLVDEFDEALHLMNGSDAGTPNKILLELKKRSPEEFDEKLLTILFELLKAQGRLKDEDYESTVSLISLVPGMVLSRDLQTRSGKLLLPRDNRVTKDHLAFILKRHLEDPLMDEIFVYRNSMGAAPNRGAA